MIKNVVEHIGGVGIYGVISVCIFFAFFLAMILWALGLNRKYLNTMRALPLENGEDPIARTQTPATSTPKQSR